MMTMIVVLMMVMMIYDYDVDLMTMVMFIIMKTMMVHSGKKKFIVPTVLKGGNSRQ